jgi:hypothetical protein
VGLAREFCDEQEGGASPIALTVRADGTARRDPAHMPVCGG